MTLGNDGSRVHQAPSAASRACSTCGSLYATDALFCPADGTPLADPQRMVDGQQDPYINLEIAGHIRLEKLAGIGAMGRVYKAFQTGIDRDVAVKVLHRELSSNAQLVGRFLREAKVASRLVHPGVVHVLLSGQMPDGALYIAMEYLDGISLGAAMAASGGALPIARALHIALQLAEAVGEAHVQGVIHRDLKPENVMLVRRGDDSDYVKVLDFGIARVSWTDPSTTTQAGLIFGTARYISPEGAEGTQVGPAGDVYALATLVYQMLVGRTPFVGEQAVGLLVQQIHDAPPDLRALRPELEVPDPIAEVVMKNLAKRPAERAPDARSFGADLSAAAVESGFDAPRASSRRVSRVSLASAAVPTRAAALGASREAVLSAAPTHATVKWGHEAGQRSVAATEASAPGVDATLDAEPPPPAPSLGSNGVVAAAAARSSGTELAFPPPRSEFLDGAVGPAPTVGPTPLPLTPSTSSSVSAAGGARRGVRTFGIVVVCFLLGAAIAVLVAYELGRIGPNAGRTAFVQKTRIAATERRWLDPPGDNVNDLTHDGLEKWPGDAELTALRDQAADAVATSAIESRRGGDVREAARLAKLAHELAPSDASKTHLFEQYSDELRAAQKHDVAPPLPPAVDAKRLATTSPTTPRGNSPGVRVLLDPSVAVPRLGQPVVFAARIFPSKAKVEDAAFAIEGPGLSSPAVLSAAPEAAGYTAGYTFLEPGRYRIRFSAKVDGGTVNAVRELVVVAAPTPGASTPAADGPPRVAPSASVKWM